MKEPRSRAVAATVLFVVVLGVGIVTSLVAILREPITERWHLRALESNDREARFRAIEYLARRGSSRALSALGPLVEGEDEEIADAAVDALVELGDVGHATLTGHIRSWRQARRALEQLEERGAPPTQLAAIVERSYLDLRFPPDRGDWLRERPELVPALVDSFLDTSNEVELRSRIGRALSQRQDLTDPRLQERRRLLEAVATDREADPRLRGPAHELIDRIDGSATDPIGAIRVVTPPAAPGGEIELVIRARLDRPLASFVLELMAPPGTVDFLRCEAGGTALEGLDARGIVAGDGRGGAFRVGYLLFRTDVTEVIEAGDDVVLTRVVGRVEAAAAPGEYRLGIVPNVSPLGGFSRSRPVEVEPAVLRIVAPEPGEASAVEAPVEDAPRATALPATELPADPADGDFRLRAELASARPAERGVEVRILATASEPSRGLSFGVRVDPAMATIRDVREGGATVAAEFGSFMFQKHVLDRGETAVGMLDMAPPLSSMPAGVDLHVATVVVDVAASMTDGTSIPVVFGAWGEPPASNIFTVRDARSVQATTHDGAILVGATPVPLVSDACADREGGAVKLTWKNPASFYLIEIERDGEALATIPGDRTFFVDATATPRAHRYRISAVRRVEGGQKRGFPVEIGVEPVEDTVKPAH